MKSKTKFRLLYSLATIFFAIGLVTLANRFLNSEDPAANSFESPAPKISDVPVESRKVTLADFQGLWDKRLQGKPQPTAKPEVVVQEKPVVPSRPSIQLPEMSLTGILYSSSFSLATFDVGGQPVTCAVGEEIKGAIVEKIEPDQVTLVYQDTTFVRKPE